VAHEALNRINGILRVGHRLPFGHLPDQSLPRLGDRHDRRGSPSALLVGDINRLTTLHHGNHRMGGSQVNTNNFAHNCLASSKTRPIRTGMSASDARILHIECTIVKYFDCIISILSAVVCSHSSPLFKILYPPIRPPSQSQTLLYSSPHMSSGLAKVARMGTERGAQRKTMPFFHTSKSAYQPDLGLEYYAHKIPRRSSREIAPCPPI